MISDKGYKNSKRNVMMRSAATELVNFFLGDSLEGIRLNRNMLGGYQRVRNSTIIGETVNEGAAEKVSSELDYKVDHRLRELTIVTRG